MTLIFYFIVLHLKINDIFIHSVSLLTASSEVYPRWFRNVVDTSDREINEQLHCTNTRVNYPKLARILQEKRDKLTRVDSLSRGANARQLSTKWLKKREEWRNAVRSEV